MNPWPIRRLTAGLLLGLSLSGCSLNLPNASQMSEPTVVALQTEVAELAARQQAAQVVRPTTPPAPAATLPPVPVQPTLAPALTEALLGQEQLLIELYRQASPAVVSIDALGIALPENHPVIPGFPQARGQGSGFLYDDQGHIVTNNHVVEDATSLQVRFFDGTTAIADLIGTDPDSDLAVIRVRELPPGVAPLPLGDSREVAVGQTAVAIGSPFGEQNTLTVGVVSGLGRTLSGPTRAFGTYSIPNIIQVDAAINPGNSGGPLLNVRGEVLGVNTAIAVSQGGSSFEGVGYAVPASTVARVVPALIANGRYEHPWMGIGMLPLDALTAARLDLPVARGVLITEVRPGSPAAAAGLRAGEVSSDDEGQVLATGSDIIIAIDGQPIADSDQLIGLLDLNHGVGDTIILSVVRADGSQADLELKLEARP